MIQLKMAPKMHKYVVISLERQQQQKRKKIEYEIP